MNKKRIKVSPKYFLDPTDGEIFYFDEVLDKEVSKFDCQDKKGSRLIFEDRMQGWFFDPALKLLDEANSSVVAVHIVTPLIEALECYKLGESSDGKPQLFLNLKLKKFSLYYAIIQML